MRSGADRPLRSCSCSAASRRWSRSRPNRTLTTELFPTEVRASANGLAHNLLGRWGQVAGPFAVNLVALELGTTGRAVAALACVNLLALPLLRWGLPETRQAELSEREARALSQ